MLQELQNLWAFLLGKTEAEVKHPLSRENAYVLASIGKKKGQYSDVTKILQGYVINEIMYSAKMGNRYVMIKYPSYASPMDKESIVDFVGDLGYTICFVNGDIIVISWKYSPNDFKNEIK